MNAPGSTDRPGYLYHEPAFPVPGKQLHRGDNKHRLKLILENYSEDWGLSNVLDLGCNVGYFSIQLAMRGARVTGVDLDAEAVAIATEQAKSYGIGSVSFQVPVDKSWLKDKQVLLALSVLPWIYQTEKEPDAYVKELFKIPMAFVEIQYPPDGRAAVPGVHDDETCRAHLEQFYTFVTKIGGTSDETDRVQRTRTMWKCVSSSMSVRNSVYGSQSIVEFRGNKVLKKPRHEKLWNMNKEAEILKRLRPYPCFPEISSASSDGIHMWRIGGKVLTAADIPTEMLAEQLNDALVVLRRHKISHNDIRPENILVSENRRVYLIDFGWATEGDEPRPEHVNPLYPGTDQEAVDKIIALHPFWLQCGKVL